MALEDQLIKKRNIMLLVVFTLGRGTARARAGASSSSVEIMAEECWRGEARAATAVVSDRARDHGASVPMLPGLQWPVSAPPATSHGTAAYLTTGLMLVLGPAA